MLVLLNLILFKLYKHPTQLIFITATFQISQGDQRKSVMMMILDIKYGLKPDLNFRWNHLSA